MIKARSNAKYLVFPKTESELIKAITDFGLNAGE
jgi:hypothetical protein